VLTGHTDNVGGLDFNMHLSQARAAAVAADLSQRCAIQADRITVKGMGPRVPVALERYRGQVVPRNRRVELSGSLMSEHLHPSLIRDSDIATAFRLPTAYVALRDR